MSVEVLLLILISFTAILYWVSDVFSAVISTVCI